mmetsp:Transcript_7288/g.9096  ORF Transcript_7288/g.9096 Transcript_7288/m.9096 type:complete len:237 (-) Transcript_7288:1044-1754(-)
MPRIVNLYKCKTLGGLGHARLVVPMVIFRFRKLALVLPFQFRGPRLVPHVIADEIKIPRIDENVNTALEQRGHLTGKSLHPVWGKLLVDRIVARLPCRARFRHVEGSLGGVQIEKMFHAGKIVTERIIPAFQANIVRVETRCIVLVHDGRHAILIGRLAMKMFLQPGLQLIVAPLDHGDALGGGVLHPLVSLVRHGLDAVRIVIRHFGEGLELDLGFRHAVSYRHTGKIQLFYCGG